MNSEEGKIWYELGLDNKQLQADAQKAKAEIRNIGNTAEAEGGRIDNAFKKAASGIGMSLAGISISGFVQKMFQVRSEFQDTESSMRVFLGSAEKAAEFMKELQDYAWYNMFEFSDLTKESAKLLAFGNDVDSVIPILDKLSNIAAGTKQPLSEFVDLYNKAKNTGKIDAIGLQSWGAKGVVITDVLKEMGIEVDRSAVKFEHLEMVLDKLTGSGGMFHGLMKEQMNNLSASFGQLQDDITIMFNEIGEKTEGVMKGAIDIADKLIQNYEKVGKTVLEIAAAYGIYKAAIMTVTAVQKIAVGTQYATEIAELSKLIPMKQQSANSDITAAVASGKLTQAKAEQLIVIRAELATKLNELNANHALAISELETATATHKAALQRALSSKAMVTQKQVELSQAKLGGDAAKIELAQKSLLEAQEERHIAVKSRKNTADALSIARSKEKAAATAMETMTDNINTASVTANTRATNILSIAKTKLTAVTARLNAVLMSNPYTFVAVAVAGLAFAIYKLITYQTEAEKAQKRLNDAVKEAEKTSLSEERELARLKGELAAATKGTDEYKKIKDEIISRYGKYKSNLEDEIEKTGLLDSSYKSLTESIRKSFGARQYKDFMQREQQNLEDVMSENLGKIQDRLYKNLGDEQGAYIYARIREAVVDGKGLSAEVEAALNKAQKKGTLLADSRIDSYIEKIKDAQKTVDELDKKAKEKFGIGDIIPPDTDKNANKTTTVFSNISDEIDVAQKNVIKFKKELEDLRSGKVQPDEGGKTVLSLIEEKVEQLQEAEKILKTLTGKDKKTEQSGESAAEKAKKQAQERADLLTKIADDEAKAD
ncbi:MAG: tape measure protein, partial [Candidatus Azobacteroides sp.]|nr:tape measure protein [Candidatus Azobacteroides sp.]